MVQMEEFENFQNKEMTQLLCFYCVHACTYVICLTEEMLYMHYRMLHAKLEAITCVDKTNWHIEKKY